MPARQFKLYWVSTPDGDEDWFAMARNKDDAARFHERSDAYPRGTARAELVAPIPSEVAERFAVTEVGWPPDAMLRALGGEFLFLCDHLSAQEALLCEMMGIGRRAVRLAGKIYVEGNVILARKAPAA